MWYFLFLSPEIVLWHFSILRQKLIELKVFYLQDKKVASSPLMADCYPKGPLGTRSDRLPSACKDANMNSYHSLV